MEMLVIVGMHRSGTSLCARICRELGVYLGDDLLDGGSDNPDGYFEDGSIVAAHSRILTLLDRKWTGDRGFLPYPADWLHRQELGPELRCLEHRAKQLCSEAGGRVPGFKDPRTARLLPAWTELLGRLGMQCRFLLTFRHPLPVSQSLASRDRMGAAQSELLWLQHNVAALSHTRGHPFLAVSYERWFTDAKSQMDQLASFIACPERAGDQVRESALSTIDAGKNHSFPAAYAPVFPMTAEIYAALQRTTSDGRAPESAWRGAAEFLTQEESMVRRVRSQLDARLNQPR